MLRFVFLFSLSFLLVANALGQSELKDRWNLYSNTRISKPLRHSEKGKVTIFQDAKISELVEEYRKADQQIRGYRVQIFFGEKKEAEDFRLRFMKTFPETMAYLTYKTPNFKVRVGDFRTRLEAEAFRYKIRDEFFDSYIVSDKINLY